MYNTNNESERNSTSSKIAPHSYGRTIVFRFSSYFSAPSCVHFSVSRLSTIMYIRSSANVTLSLPNSLSKKGSQQRTDTYFRGTNSVAVLSVPVLVSCLTTMQGIISANEEQHDPKHNVRMSRSSHHFTLHLPHRTSQHH